MNSDDRCSRTRDSVMQPPAEENNRRMLTALTCAHCFLLTQTDRSTRKPAHVTYARRKSWSCPVALGLRTYFNLRRLSACCDIQFARDVARRCTARSRTPASSCLNMARRYFGALVSKSTRVERDSRLCSTRFSTDSAAEEGAFVALSGEPPIFASLRCNSR